MGNELLAWPEETDREVIIRALRKSALHERRIANTLAQQLGDFPDDEYKMVREYINRCKKRAGRFMRIALDLEEEDDDEG